jgi:hypothetical protein
MGMFDNIIVDNKILPDLTEGERSQLKNWQTKDFENMLTNVYIVEDKDTKFRHSFTGSPKYKIQIKEFEFDTVPLSERPDPENPLFGCLRETNVRIVDSDYTGQFRFYSHLGNFNTEHKWYEFIGEAEKGKIISLKRLTESN